MMKILVISNMYPGRNKNFLYQGIFVAEQVASLNEIKSVACDLLIIDGYRGKSFYLWGAIQAYFKVLFGGYDVIHVHYGLSGLFLLLNPFKRKWGNVFITLHGGDILIKQGKRVQVFLTKLIVKRAGMVFTLNDEMDELLRKADVDYLQLPCGCDDELFSPDESVAKENMIVFPGDDSRSVKNYPLFKEIVSEFNKTNIPLKIVILNNMTRIDVRNTLRKARILLMTSISEGSPQVIKEAMLCDLAIVSVDVGDVKKTLSNTAGTHIFLHTDSVSDVALCIKKAMVDSQVNPGARRERALELELDSKSVARKLVDIYTRKIGI